MKLSVIYHSVTGNTKNMGELIAKGMNSVEDMEAKAFSIDDVDFEFVKQSSCVVLGAPTYMGHLTAQMMNFLQTHGKDLGAAGKLCGAYATAQYVHGGAEFSIQEMMVHLLVLGGLFYSGGSSFGKPIIHTGPVGIDNTLDIQQFAANFEAYGQRMALKAKELFA